MNTMKRIAYGELSLMDTASITEWDGTVETVLYLQEGDTVYMIYLDGMEARQHTVSASYFWDELYAVKYKPLVS